MGAVLQLMLVLASLCIVVTSSPVNRKPYVKYLKGPPPPRHVIRQDAVKGHATTPVYPRKGEYPCATGICRLKPGEIPPNCRDGECQYPLQWR